MDLNELYSRYQIALIGMLSGGSDASRGCAEKRAGYYAARIDTLRDRIGADRTPTHHSDLKRIVRG